MAGMLSGTVNVPHVGTFPKAAVVIGVGGVIGLIVYEKRKQSKAASAPSTAPGTAAGDPYPPDGTTGNPSDPYSLDPSTNQTYGDEAAGYSAAAGGLGSLYGTGYGGYGGVTGYGTAGSAYGWDGTYGNPNDPYSMDPSTGLTYGAEGSYGTAGGTPAGPPFSTNAQWSQYVLNYFSTNQFGDLAGMTTAIGLYLAGQAVDAQQATYIHDATAIGGTPPVAGPGNFPPSIRQQGSHGGTVTVPDVAGTDVRQATQILTTDGLKVSAPAGAKGVEHIVTKQSPGAGSHVQKGTTVKLTTKTVPEHKPPKPKPKPRAHKPGVNPPRTR